MTYVLAVVAGIVGAVIGGLVTSAIAAWLAGLFGMSDFEGARGMFAVFAVGPIGGFLSMIGSAWLVLRVGKGAAPLGPTLARLAVVLVGIAAVVGVAIWVRLATLDIYTNTVEPSLEFELRVPATMSVPDPPVLRVEVHTDKNVGEGRLEEHWSPAQDGRKVIAGQVSLTRKTTSRLLVVFMPDQATRLFRLALPRDPPTTPNLSPWYRANNVDIEGEAPPRAAPADDPVEVRYRVRRAGDD